jgi:hypothetical protein
MLRPARLIALLCLAAVLLGCGTAAPPDQLATADLQKVTFHVAAMGERLNLL